MKRINPQTGVPFKRGELRQDGYKFWQYQKTAKNNFGFFKECWLQPDKFGPNYRNCEYKKIVTTPKGRASHMWLGARNRAKDKNLDFNLSKSAIVFKIEHGFCEVTGLKFELNQNQATFQNPYAPSLDRIDSNKGYTDENVRVVLYAVNRALGEEGERIMLPIFKALVSAIELKI